MRAVIPIYLINDCKSLSTAPKRKYERTTFAGVITMVMKFDSEVLLFLDDCRNPSDCAKYMHLRNIDNSIYLRNWTIVRSYNEFVEWIKQHGLPAVISFDHDLDDSLSGMDCAKWLVDYCLNNGKLLPKYAVHSANPPGAENIEGLFKSFENLTVKK